MPVYICTETCVYPLLFRSAFSLFCIPSPNDIMSYFLLTIMTACHIMYLGLSGPEFDNREVKIMKFCTHCGREIMEEAVVCPGCGCSVAAASVATAAPVAKSSGLATAAKVFMVLGTIIMGIYLIPLAWCIPMTVTYFNKVKNNQPVGTGFKVCCLLFVSLLGGIFMLCDKEN